jgi:trehalose/maltose transport system substrate-binding protein
MGDRWTIFVGLCKRRLNTVNPSPTHSCVRFPHRPARCFRCIAPILICFLLAPQGCDSTVQPTNETTVTLIDQAWLDKEYQEGWERELSDFTRETGIRVEVLPSSEAPVDELATWIQLLGSQARIPDVYAIDVIWPKILADNLLDLKAYVPENEIKAHLSDLVANDTVDGRLVALPYHIDVGILYYRTDLLRRYGFRAPPSTWDELENMAAKIQAGERARGHKDFWGFVWQGSPSEALTCNGLEWQVSEGGGAIVDDGKITVNNSRTIRSWERAAHWVGRISPPGVVAYQEVDAVNIWRAGGAAFMRSWTNWLGPYLWGRSEGSDAVVNNFNVAPLPGGAAGRVGTLGGHSYGISRYSAHPQAAASLIRYLCRRDVERRHLLAYSGVPTIPELYQDPGVLAATPYLPGLLEAYKKVFAVRPSTATGKNYPAVSRAYFDAVHSVLTGKKTAANAAVDLQDELVRITGFEAKKSDASDSAGDIVSSSSKGTLRFEGNQNEQSP